VVLPLRAGEHSGKTYGNRKAARLLCYDYSKNKLLAALLILCPNLEWAETHTP